MAEQTYSRQQVESWQSKLEDIAVLPRTTFTKRQAVEEMIDSIEKALLARSYAEVAEGLSEWGLDISEGALKQYVARYRKAMADKGGKSSGKKRTVKAAGKRGQSSAGSASQKTSNKGADRAAQKDAVLAAIGANGKGRTNGFLEMPEDL